MPPTRLIENRSFRPQEADVLPSTKPNGYRGKNSFTPNRMFSVAPQNLRVKGAKIRCRASQAPLTLTASSRAPS